MTRTKAALGLLVGVVGAAGCAQTVAERQFCRSLSYLDSSLQSLTTSSDSSDFASNADKVRNGWNSVQEQASSLTNIDMQPLDQAFTAFSTALESVPGDASVEQAEQAVSSSADSLQATTASTMRSYGCSG